MNDDLKCRPFPDCLPGQRPEEGAENAGSKSIGACQKYEVSVGLTRIIPKKIKVLKNRSGTAFWRVAQVRWAFYEETKK